MDLILTADEVHTLREVFEETLRELRREVARTEAKDFRHRLVLRQELVERLLAQLERALHVATPQPSAR